jgi:hypothetical protein
VLALAGCGAGHPQGPLPATLLAGRRGSLPSRPQLIVAARLVRRAAALYARGAYRRVPPRLPAASATVRGALAAAARRVPPSRRALRPRLLGLRLSLLGPRAVRASAAVGDGRFTSFSIAFTLSLRGGRWEITAISLPD